MSNGEALAFMAFWVVVVLGGLWFVNAIASKYWSEKNGD